MTTSFPLEKSSSSGIFIKKLVDYAPPEIQYIVLTPDNHSKIVPAAQRLHLVRYRYGPKKWQKLAHRSGGIVAALSQRKPTCLLIPVLLMSSLIMSCWYARKVDVIHANWSINGVIAGIAGLLLRKPVVSTLRGSDVNLMQQSWLMRQLVRITLCLSVHVVTVSHSLKREVEGAFPKYYKEIHVVPNGIGEDFFVQRNTEKQPHGAVKFLYVGNLMKNKGLHLILEATVLLSCNNWSLDIVGDGPEKEELERFCRDNIKNSKVIFHGAVPPDTVPLFMEKADVFVFPSFSEGRPNVVIEAMAAGLPVIAAAIPAVKELIEDKKHGLLCPVGDPERLKDAMEFLICHSDRAEAMGQNARQCISSLKITWEITALQYKDIYRQAINGARRK